jgi:hypothetical protein
MQDCKGKHFGALVTTIPLLMLAIIMLGAPSASGLVPFRAITSNHHTGFVGSPTDTSLLPFHGLSVNYHTGSTPALKLHYGDNSNSHVSDAISFVGFKHIGKTVSQPSITESKNNNDNNNYKYTYNNKNNDNNNYKYTYNNNHHGLDVQDKSFVKAIKITDVDRSNPHLLKVTLERTHNDIGNIPKYISVVAVGKNDQTVAGSTTLKGDDINNSLTVNVILKNKNNKNGHLDASGDVTVWVVPATISN